MYLVVLSNMYSLLYTTAKKKGYKTKKREIKDTISFTIAMKRIKY